MCLCIYMCVYACMYVYVKCHVYVCEMMYVFSFTITTTSLLHPVLLAPNALRAALSHCCLRHPQLGGACRMLGSLQEPTVVRFRLAAFPAHALTGFQTGAQCCLCVPRIRCTEYLTCAVTAGVS